MNKLFKSIAVFALAAFSVACSSDRDLDSAANENGNEEGVILEVDLSIGSSSRFTYSVDDMTETTTYYSWYASDSIYVIDDEGRYLGTLKCSQPTAVDKYTGKFVSDKKIPLQNGQKIHLWFFGQAQKPFGDYGHGIGTAYWGTHMGLLPKYDKPSINKGSIYKGTVDIDNSTQYLKEIGTHAHTAAMEADTKFNEVLARTAIVNVNGTQATATDAIDKTTIVKMQHLTSVVSLHLNKKYASCVKISGCYSKATFDLVNEKITSTKLGDITYYNNTQYSEVENIDLVLFPGEQAPKLSFNDINDDKYTGQLTNKTIKPAVHYIDWTQGKDKEYRIPIDFTYQAGTNTTIPTEFPIGNDRKVVFGKGNLWANGTSYPATVGQAKEQWYVNYTNTINNGYGDYYKWAWYDADNVPVNVFETFTSPLNQRAFFNTTSGQELQWNNPYNPGYIFTNANGYHAQYRLLTLNEWEYILTHNYWIVCELTDVTMGYGGSKHPYGILILPPEFNIYKASGELDHSVSMSLVSKLLGHGFGGEYSSKLLEVYAEAAANMQDAALETLKQTGFSCGIIPNQSNINIGYAQLTSQQVEMPENNPTGWPAYSGVFLPLFGGDGGDTFNPYWTGTSAGGGNANVLDLIFTSGLYGNPHSLNIGFETRFGTQTGMIRLVKEIQ